MGKSMPKSKVIWGEKKSVSLASFNETHIKQIVELIRANAGPKAFIQMAAVRAAIAKAKANPKMKNGYVKMGLIGSDLVVRVKEKRFLGDIEIDAVVVSRYPEKVKQYAPIKRQLELEKIQKDLDKVTKRSELTRARRGSGVAPVQKPSRPTSPKPQLKPRESYLKKNGQSQVAPSKDQVEPEQVSPPTPVLTKQPSQRELEQREQEVEEIQKELDQLEKEAEEARQRRERLREVMGRKDESGDTLRDRLLRAAQKAQMLGIGDYAQQKLKAQGLTPMHVDYHGEVLDHQKNRYGRYLNRLWAVYQKSNAGVSFSRWLDEVEARNENLPGVSEALGLDIPMFEGGGKIVQQGGVTGGRVIYLNDEERKDYLVTVNKGIMTGKHVSNGSVIFVIGPDNKVYAGQKARAKPGERRAFNHSSFFSGGPVKSAGTVTVSGGKIVKVSNESGHYAPTAAMMMTAVRKFAGGSKEWLDQVMVAIGSKTSSGTDFLQEERRKEQEATWGKYSAGRLTETQAGRLLEGTPPGSWIVWQNGNRGLYLSHNKGGGLTHAPIVELGAQGLQRKDLLHGDKLPKQSTLTNSQTTAKPRSTSGKSTEDPSAPVDTQKLEALKKTAAWHANVNTTQAVKLLENQPHGTYLLRPSSRGGIAFSYVLNGKILHALINTVGDYEEYEKFAKLYNPLSDVNQSREAELKRSPAWHPNLNTAATEKLLEDKPLYTWLLRPSSQGGVVLSRKGVDGPEHMRITSQKAYESYREFTEQFPTMMLRA